MTTLRVFFAIDLPLEFKNKLEDCLTALKKQFKKKSVRWAKPDNIHVTLQFLAQVKKEHIPLLLQKVAQELKQMKPFHLTLGSLEWFPTIYHPRIISLQIGPQDLLAELSRAIGKGMTEVGYSIEERPFRGHLTLGRVESVVQANQEVFDSIDVNIFPEVMVNEIVLFCSEPGQDGSKYTRLGGVPLL